MNQYFINLFNKILEHDDNNKYILFCSEQNINELKKLNNSVWGKEGILLTSLDHVAHHLKDIDLYFCPFGSLWPRPLPIPAVVTIPDIQEVFYPNFFSEFELYFREFHYRGSSKIADRVITISNFSKETLVNHYGISSEKVTVAYPNIDQIFYGPKNQLPGNNIPFSSNQFILYPANQWLHKNHDGLLRAIKYLKEQKRLTINVIFTGHDMPGGYPLRSKIKEYGLSEQIWVGGYLPKEELAYLYGKAKMVVFPSLFEGFGLPLLEAMAAGCPIATSNATSLPEIGAAAVEYFDPNKPLDIAHVIENLWNNPDKLKELIVKGFERLKSFSATNFVQKHYEAFEEAYRSFSSRRYYRHLLWTHPVHKLRVRWKYRKLIIRRYRQKKIK